MVTSALRPTALREAPATVYVITGEDIRASGAQTIWDALRSAPGVDVVAFRTLHAEVNVRGLTKSSNNRTLVLLDGKTLLESFYDTITWEAVPVTLEEIDRIEVVAGPASALYGGNATSGVINIITKTPEELNGGFVSYTGGERRTHIGTALYGKKRGRTGVKLGAGWHSSNRFEAADTEASRAGKVHASVGYDLSEYSRLGVSGGVANVRTQKSPTSTEDGPNGFLRVDYTRRDTRLRAFWNRGTVDLLGPILSYTRDFHTYDLHLEQTLAPHAAHSLVVGAGFRRNRAASTLFAPGTREQDLWELMLEETWHVLDNWTLVAGGRLDKHPFLSWVGSPRVSLNWAVTPNHAARATASRAFRKPTLIENFIETDVTLSSSPASPVRIRLISTNNKNLIAEDMSMYELAYTARFGDLRAQAVGFRYVLYDQIVATATIGPPVDPQTITLSFTNAGRTEAWGGELSADYPIRSWLSAFGNYSYQSLEDDRPTLLLAPSAPRHKVNGGLRLSAGGLNANLWAHWVDKTSWRQNTGLSSKIILAEVRDYTLLNARVGYTFPGRYRGLEAAVSVFNLLSREHYEILPALGGELIGRRWAGSVSYKF